MFDIYGKPPFHDHEQKITSRDTQQQAVDFARNLASYGYSNLRVSEGEAGPAVKQVNPPVGYPYKAPDAGGDASAPTPTQASGGQAGGGSAGTPGGGVAGGTAPGGSAGSVAGGGIGGTAAGAGAGTSSGAGAGAGSSGGGTGGAG
jgi:hypothetical protein